MPVASESNRRNPDAGIEGDVCAWLKGRLNGSSWFDRTAIERSEMLCDDRNAADAR